jgi:hypothetical protein
MRKFIDGLLNLRPESMESSLSSILDNIQTSYREKVYQGLLMGIVFNLSESRYIVRPEEKTGQGFADLTIRTKNDRSAAWIIEIKVEKNRAIKPNAGISQAEKQDYIANFEREGYQKGSVNLIEIIIKSNRVKHIGIKKASELE